MVFASAWRIARDASTSMMTKERVPLRAASQSAPRIPVIANGGTFARHRRGYAAFQTSKKKAKFKKI
jgi:hypothetical protein